MTEDHKKRFPRQYLYFQMKQNEQDAPAVGTSLDIWFAEGNGDITRGHIEELRILKFQTVEQIAAASDAQLQRIGMGRVCSQVAQLLRVIGQVVEQANIILAVDKFPGAAPDHEERCFAALSHVFADGFIVAARPLQMGHQ